MQNILTHLLKILLIGIPAAATLYCANEGSLQAVAALNPNEPSKGLRLAWAGTDILFSYLFLNGTNYVIRWMVRMNEILKRGLNESGIPYFDSILTNPVTPSARFLIGGIYLNAFAGKLVLPK